MMTTAILDPVRVDAITQRASRVKPGRTLLALFVGVFTLAGWLAAKGFMVVWAVATLAWAAAAEGWESARGPSRRQQIAVLTSRVEHLATENRRLGGSG